MSLPKRVLIALTSYNGVFYADGAKTGLFYSEASHPYHVYTKAGFEVDFVSETGTFGLDEHSISLDFLSQQEIDEHNDQDAAITKAFNAVKTPDQVNSKDYGIFFAAGGHATLFDFPTASKLQQLAAEIYQAGGIVAAVCHGPAIFANLKDLETGEHIAKGKKVTAFTDLGESLMGLTQILIDNNVKTCEHVYKEIGSVYVAPAQPFDDFGVVDGRIATGPNPASAGSLATKTLNVYKDL